MTLEDRLSDGCLVLERELTCGGKIGWQDGVWHLFQSCGCSVTSGAKSLEDLILSLADHV